MARRPSRFDRTPEREIWVLVERVAEFYRLTDYIRTIADANPQAQIRLYLQAYLTVQPVSLPKNVSVVPYSRRSRRSLLAQISERPPKLVVSGTDKPDFGMVALLNSFSVPVILLLSDQAGHSRSVKRMASLPHTEVLHLLCQSEELVSFVQTRKIENAYIENIGPIGDMPRPAQVDEKLLQQFRNLLVRRPVWQAVNILREEFPLIAEAQRVVRISYPNALCLISCRDAVNLEELQSDYPRMNIRSVHSRPDPTSELFFCDLRNESALWNRLASVSFLGGSMYPEPMADPIGPAVLGSALIGGPHSQPFGEIMGRFAAAGASIRVETSVALIEAVRTLLVPDNAAKAAVAAWEVLTEGSIATDRLTAVTDQILQGKSNS